MCLISSSRENYPSFYPLTKASSKRRRGGEAFLQTTIVAWLAFFQFCALPSCMRVEDAAVDGFDGWQVAGVRGECPYEG
jgi:hypothetical protein